MRESDLKKESYLDIEDLIENSLSDKKITDDKEDLILEYLCQTISRSDSFDSIKKRADRGDQYAYIQLASWYISHAENVKDYCNAYDYAKKAAKAGYVEANYLLGQLYYYGTGCERDLGRAVKCFKTFTEEVKPKQLLNDSVLADSYLKLANIEKSFGRYDRSSFYLQKLEKLSPEYKKNMDEYEEELEIQQKENTSIFFHFMFFVFLVICICIIVFSYINRATDEHAAKYQQGAKVTVVEKKEIQEQDVPTDVQIKEPELWHIVSEEEFAQSNMNEIAVKKVEATSEYRSRAGNNYSVEHLIDHDEHTFWQEGASDAGIGQRIVFELPKTAMISGIKIKNGKAIAQKEDYLANNRVKIFHVNEDWKIELPDTMEPVYLIFDVPIVAEKINFIIRDTYAGETYNDTCVTEILLYE